MPKASIILSRKSRWLNVGFHTLSLPSWDLKAVSGRFKKLNKRVAFPKTLDVSPYMSENADGNDKYMLYGVVVHVDMLNASYFGHYICYMKDFSGNRYRIDDCKVGRVELDEVLSQGAYMLLYSSLFPVTNMSFDALLESLLSTAKPFPESVGYRILAS
ncbi:ubiquitin carboxyl-terminal hydrolase 18-like protein [Tanacetum coccineum]